MISELVIAETHPKKALLSNLLLLSDMFFFTNLVMFYKLISNIVHAISYMQEENKIKIEALDKKLKL